VKHVKTLLILYIIKDYNEEEQFTIFFILQDYNIIKKLEAIITDNSDINDTFCQEIKTYLLNKENLI